MKRKAINGASDIMDLDDVRRWTNGEGPYRMGIALRCIEVLMHNLPIGIGRGVPYPFYGENVPTGKLEQ